MGLWGWWWQRQDLNTGTAGCTSSSFCSYAMMPRAEITGERMALELLSEKGTCRIWGRRLGSRSNEGSCSRILETAQEGLEEPSAPGPSQQAVDCLRTWSRLVLSPSSSSRLWALTAMSPWKFISSHLCWCLNHPDHLRPLGGDLGLCHGCWPRLRHGHPWSPHWTPMRQWPISSAGRDGNTRVECWRGARPPGSDGGDPAHGSPI